MISSNLSYRPALFWSTAISGGVDRKTHQCYPSYETIGEAVGLCKNTVQKCICELVDADLVCTENTSVITKNGLKHNGTLLYTIQPVQDVLEAHYQNRLRKLEVETAFTTHNATIGRQA